MTLSPDRIAELRNNLQNHAAEPMEGWIDTHDIDDLLLLLDECERARPLIEAVMGARLMATRENPKDIIIVEEDVASILRAALAYKEQSK